MAKYFRGRNQIGQFQMFVENKRGRIDCKIFEEWLDTDESTTAYCGNSGTCVVESSIGLSEKASSTLKGVIEASIGIKDLLSLKSQVEETIGREVNWSFTNKVTKTFTFNAPTCGRYTLVIYELTRFYMLTYYRKKTHFFGEDAWIQTWTRTIAEGTNNHDGLPDFDDYHEVCNCPGKNDTPPLTGYISFDMGCISFRAPYHLTDGSVVVHIPEKTFKLKTNSYSARDLAEGFSAIIPASMVPEPLLFLGGITAQKIKCRIQEFVDQETSLFEKQTDEEVENADFDQEQGSESL